MTPLKFLALSVRVLVKPMLISAKSAGFDIFDVSPFNPASR